MTFCTPSLPGSSQQDSPSLTGWGIAGLSGDQENEMQAYEVLRRDSDPPSRSIPIPADCERVFSLAMSAWIRNDIHGFWMEPESRDGHCNPDAFVISIGDRYAELSTLYNGKATQSPIEDQLLGALMWVEAEWAGFPRGDMLDGPFDDCHDQAPDQLEFWITPQAKIGKYKADLLLWFRLRNALAGIAVECDGHAFHEKTKEQASKDKERDRFFLTAGFPVMRFSGSDIFNKPLDCAAEVHAALVPALTRVCRDGGMLA